MSIHHSNRFSRYSPFCTPSGYSPSKCLRRVRLIDSARSDTWRSGKRICTSADDESMRIAAAREIHRPSSITGTAGRFSRWSMCAKACSTFTSPPLSLGSASRSPFVTLPDSWLARGPGSTSSPECSIPLPDLASSTVRPSLAATFPDPRATACALIHHQRTLLLNSGSGVLLPLTASGQSSANFQTSHSTHSLPACVNMMPAASDRCLSSRSDDSRRSRLAFHKDTHFRPGLGGLPKSDIGTNGGTGGNSWITRGSVWRSASASLAIHQSSASRLNSRSSASLTAPGQSSEKRYTSHRTRSFPAAVRSRRAPFRCQCSPSNRRDEHVIRAHASSSEIQSAPIGGCCTVLVSPDSAGVALVGVVGVEILVVPSTSGREPSLLCAASRYHQ